MKKWLKITFITSVTLLVLLVGAFLIYASDYYRADDVALATMQSNDNILLPYGKACRHESGQKNGLWQVY